MQRNITYSSTVEDIEMIKGLAKEIHQSQAFIHAKLIDLGIKQYNYIRKHNPNYCFLDA